MNSRMRRGQKGFTLIELLAVMAIIGILAAIVVPAVSGTGESSRDAQVKQDGSSTDSAAGDFFSHQQGAEVLLSKTVTVTASINGDTAAAKTQLTSSRWPEEFITDGTSTAALYQAEFPTTSGTGVEAVAITDKNGATISRTTLLTGYTAIDFGTLVSEGFVQRAPDGVDSLSGDIFHNYLWLFKKETSASGSGQDDSRKVAVFKLVNVTVTGTSAGSTLPGALTGKTVKLTFEQIF